jgi:hypothetical protein
LMHHYLSFITPDFFHVLPKPNLMPNWAAQPF